jgi:serine/threonine protein kinase
MIEIGQRIGNYQVTKKLGGGGMGVVFEAVHTQIAGQAAIKVPLPQYAAEPQVAQRRLGSAACTLRTVWVAVAGCLVIAPGQSARAVGTGFAMALVKPARPRRGVQKWTTTRS